MRDSVARALGDLALARTQVARQSGRTRVTQTGPHDRLAALPAARGRAALSHRESVGSPCARAGRSRHVQPVSVESERMCGDGTSQVNGPPLARRSSGVGFRRNQRNRLLSEPDRRIVPHPRRAAPPLTTATARHVQRTGHLSSPGRSRSRTASPSQLIWTSSPQTRSRECRGVVHPVNSQQPRAAIPFPPRRPGTPPLRDFPETAAR